MMKYGLEEVKTMSDTLNIEAIVEGLLYMVGDDGLKVEQLASVIDKSIEDSEAILNSIQSKYSNENFGIELVNYGKTYKFITKQEVALISKPYFILVSLILYLKVL